ncbi:MAG: glycosyltransferase family 39 protein [Endomicrobiaceae bacterium]|nr:glycosyltransferase family 39 protein [Endomicrobiaceae bacterium]
MKKIFAFFSHITNKQAVILILMIACFHALNTFMVLNHNSFYSYLSEDVTSIIDMSTSFVHEYNICGQIVNGVSFSEITHTIISYWKPPAYFIFSLPFLILIYNINLFITVLNFFISVVTLLSVYGICKRLHSVKSGLFASFLLSFYPLFFVMHRTFFIETFLMSAVSLTLYLCIADNFYKKYFNVLFVIVLLIGFLTKEQFFIYVPVFFLFLLGKENYKNIQRNILIMSDFAAAVLFSYAVWYIYNAPNIFSHLYKYASEIINPDSFFYLKSLYYFDVTPVIFILSVISLAYFISIKKYLKITLSLIFIIFLFSLSGNKVSRHIFPALIFCSIISSLFIFEIKNYYIKRTIIFLISIFLITQFMLISYSNCLNFKSGNFYGYNSFRGITYFDYKPNMETYKAQYEKFNALLGENFEYNTAFIQFFPSTAYNFLILQKDRRGILCKVNVYDEIQKIKMDINNYKNIIISSRNQNIFESFNRWLFKNTEFKQITILNIHNHDNAKVYLYQR